jgi:hypothetical protein
MGFCISGHSGSVAVLSFFGLQCGIDFDCNCVIIEKVWTDLVEQSF